MSNGIIHVNVLNSERIDMRIDCSTGSMSSELTPIQAKNVGTMLIQAAHRAVEGGTRQSKAALGKVMTHAPEPQEG